MQPTQRLFADPGLPQRGPPVPVAAPGSHRAHVGDVEPESGLQDRHIDLRIVGEHADHAAVIEVTALGGRGQELMGPGAHHLRAGEDSGSVKAAGDRTA